MQGLIVSCFSLACSGLGVLLAWVTRWSEAAFSPRYLHLVPFGAIMCYTSLSAGRSPKVCGEWYRSWEMSWNRAFYGLWVITDWRWCQRRPDRYGSLSMMVDVPQNVSVIRVKESWEGDEFSSPAGCLTLLAVSAVSPENAFWVELVWRRQAPLTTHICTSRRFVRAFLSSLPVSLQTRWNLFSPAMLILCLLTVLCCRQEMWQEAPFHREEPSLPGWWGVVVSVFS